MNKSNGKAVLPWQQMRRGIPECRLALPFDQFLVLTLFPCLSWWRGVRFSKREQASQCFLPLFNCHLVMAPCHNITQAGNHVHRQLIEMRGLRLCCMRHMFRYSVPCQVFVIRFILQSLFSWHSVPSRLNVNFLWITSLCASVVSSFIFKSEKLLFCIRKPVEEFR